MDQCGFWIPGLAFGSPGMTKERNNSPGMTKKKALPRLVPGRLAGMTEGESSRKARSAYPGSRKNIGHGSMDGRGFWIPGLASLARNDEEESAFPAGAGSLGRNDKGEKLCVWSIRKLSILSWVSWISWQKCPFL